MLTEGRGVNIILDMVGGPYMARNIRSLGMDGRLVMIAFLQGSKVQDFDFVPVMIRRLTITGSTGGHARRRRRVPSPPTCGPRSGRCWMRDDARR